MRRGLGVLEKQEEGIVKIMYLIRTDPGCIIINDCK